MVKQSELRQDPLTGQWVVLESAAKPSDFEREPARPGQATSDCPFCEGHEASTDAEILAVRDGSLPNERGWQLRVVPNKFPIFRIDADPGPRTDGLFVSQPGLGAHEVVIETPLHESSLQDLDADSIARVLGAWRSRIEDLKRDQRFACALPFKNHGRLASARLDHAHSQIVAYPFVPPALVTEVTRAKAYFDTHGRGLFEDLVVQELDHRVRVVTEDACIVAFAPYAPRVAFHLVLAPRLREARFEAATPDTLTRLAAMLKDMLQRLDRALERPAYNLMLHTAPFRGDADKSFHWWLEILPRINRVGGQEWGSGIARNPVFPEDAAASLRREIGGAARI